MQRRKMLRRENKGAWMDVVSRIPSPLFWIEVNDLENTLQVTITFPMSHTHTHTHTHTLSLSIVFINSAFPALQLSVPHSTAIYLPLYASAVNPCLPACRSLTLLNIPPIPVCPRAPFFCGVDGGLLDSVSVDVDCLMRSSCSCSLSGCFLSVESSRCGWA